MSELIREFKFIGPQGIEQVTQPEETELCFASIVSAMTGASVTEAHKALVAQELSQPDGSTGPLGTPQLEVAGSVLDIEPVVDPFSGADKPEAAMKSIDEALIAVRAVALLYKKTHDPEDDQHHWTLLTGYIQQDGEKGAMRVMDPLRPRISYIRQALIKDMVERSMDYMGVYAYALSTQEK